MCGVYGINILSILGCMIASYTKPDNAVNFYKLLHHKSVAVCMCVLAKVQVPVLRPHLTSYQDLCIILWWLYIIYIYDNIIMRDVTKGRAFTAQH